MSRKIQRSRWRDGGHGIRRSPRISTLGAWKYSQKVVGEEENHQNHQGPPSETKRELHHLSIECRNHEDGSTNSDQPLVTKYQGSTRLDDHDTSTAQPSVMTTASLMPEKRILELVLDILQRRDTYEIFGEPVDPKEVDDYYEIIERPMDFGTMRAKLHDGLYKTLEQFEHDAFLIPRNAMHFNSTATIYFRQARAIYELAKKVFHVLKTDPENIELEFSMTRRRSGRRPQGEGKSLHINSSHSVATNIRTQSSLSGPSNLKRRIWRNPGFSPKVDKRIYVFAPGAIDGQRSSIVEVNRHYMYRPLMSFQHENDCIDSTGYSEPKTLAHVNQGDISYRESLTLFAKNLGPTAQMVANRKLQGWSKDSPILQTPPSKGWGQAQTWQFPAAFPSAKKGPPFLDLPISNTSQDFFYPVHGKHDLEATPDTTDLTSADDRDEVNIDNALGGKFASTNKGDGMGNHSALARKVPTNNVEEMMGSHSDLLGKVDFNNEESTSGERYWINRYSISHSDKIREKEINEIHLSLLSSTSGADKLNSSAIGINDTSKKSVAAILDSCKMDDQEHQTTLASYSSHSSESKFKLRDGNSSITFPWPWHTKGASKHERLAAVELKGGTNSSSFSQATVESNPLTPLASPFVFDLPFLKSRLDQMKGQNGFLQPRFQQITDKEGQPSSGCTRKAVMSTSQLSRLATNYQQCSICDTNLALKL